MTDDEVDFWRHGAGEPHHPRLDWTNDPDRRLSLTVRCRRCTAPPNVVCRNVLKAGPKGELLTFDEAPDLKKLPAHPIRITDAKRGPKQL